MNSRRSILIGGACLAAAGAAYAMTPRQRVSLLGSGALAPLLPLAVPGWAGRDVSGLVAAATDGTLEAKLYNEMVQRLYEDPAGNTIMMMVAHGPTQSNDLQLHRPEVCYPAFGYKVFDSRPRPLPLARGAILPGRSMVAEQGGRRETVLYWTRLGEFLPVNGSEQRLDRVRLALQGQIGDGVLARFSMVEEDSAVALSHMSSFVAALIAATSANGRRALIGTALTAALARA
jgi:EpsI family protein